MPDPSPPVLSYATPKQRLPIHVHFKRLALGAAILASLPAIELLGHIIELAQHRELERISSRLLFALMYWGPDTLIALLLIAGVALVAYSKDSPRRRGYRTCITLAALIPLLWTWDLVSFETFSVASMRTYWMLHELCHGLIFAFQFTLTIAAWAFMNDLASRLSLRGLVIVTHALAPLTALALFALIFTPLIDVQWRDSFYYPSLIISGCAVFIYWLCVAFIAGHMARAGT